MKQIVWISLLALALSACGSSSDEPVAQTKPVRPPSEYFQWNDPGIASGNFDADYADCKTQVEKDPAITAETPQLVVLSAYMKCMAPKGWKFVDPDAAGQP